MIRNRIQNLSLVLSIGFYLLSLTKLVVTTEKETNISGFFALLVGWFDPVWLANPLIFVSWFLLKKYTKVSIVLCSISAFIAYRFLEYKEIMINEAGHMDKIVSIEYGYWFWLFSSIILFLGGLISLFFEELNNKITY
jgi:hypothetical protein